MVEIRPSILVKTFEDFEEKVKKVESLVERVHLDIADGLLVANTTIKGYEELAKINSPLKWSIHLMVFHPEEQLEFWYETAVDEIFVHREMRADVAEVLQEIRSHGRQVGLVVNPETPVNDIIEFTDLIDYIQFMTVNPGFSGSDFLEQSIDKVSEFHEQFSHIPILVDGGINPETAPRAIAAGALILVVGSYLWQSDDITKAISELRSQF